jgi:hypothetical protein
MLGFKFEHKKILEYYIRTTGAERVSQQQWPQAHRARETEKKFGVV